MEKYMISSNFTVTNSETFIYDFSHNIPLNDLSGGSKSNMGINRYTSRCN